MDAQYGSSKPRLDARLKGTDLFTAPANSTSEHIFYFTFDCKFNGIEMFAWDSNKGDHLALFTDYYVPPLASWKRYKKFGKHFNVYPNNLQKYVLFPTEPSNGVRLRLEYTNTGNTAVDFSLNLFMFADRSLVDTSTASEGEDW